MRISDWSSDVCSSDLSAMLLVPIGRRRSRDRSIAALPSRMVWSVSLIVIGASALERRERAVGAADARLRLARALGARDIALRFGEIGRASCRARVCQ